MEAMTEEQRNQATHGRLMEALTEWRRQGSEGERVGVGGEWEIVSVERTELITVMLEYGGPTTWLDFEHRGGDVTECRYWTSAYSDSHNSHRNTFVDLGASRGQEFFDLLGLGD